LKSGEAALGELLWDLEYVSASVKSPGFVRIDEYERKLRIEDMGSLNELEERVMASKVTCVIDDVSKISGKIVDPVVVFLIGPKPQQQ
jgi:hypothetical protein